jgi:MazG family protein
LKVIPSEVEESRNEPQKGRGAILQLRGIYPEQPEGVERASLRMTAFEKLCEIVAKLRAPGGCPWDREQTHESLLPAVIEEAYEVAGAVRANDNANFREELGDLLLLIVMHAQIASESDRFDINGVLKNITEKLIRRHPHVFGNSDARDSGAVLKQWESIKRAEKTGKPGRDAGDAGGHYLDELPLALPALMRAQKAQSKVARVNFDWTEVRDVIAKVEEEIQELKQAVLEHDRKSIEDEVGDLLFAVVNLARKCKLDAESALQGATDKFAARFNRLEDELRRQGKRLGDANLVEMDAIWNAIKKDAGC